MYVWRDMKNCRPKGRVEREREKKRSGPRNEAIRLSLQQTRPRREGDRVCHPFAGVSAASENAQHPHPMGESQVESTPRSGVNASTMALKRPSAWI